MVGMLCKDIAQTCYLTAAAHNISHVFFCGSVTGASSYIREQVKMVLSVKGILNSQVNVVDVKVTRLVDS